MAVRRGVVAGILTLARNEDRPLLRDPVVAPGFPQSPIVQVPTQLTEQRRPRRHHRPELRRASAASCACPPANFSIGVLHRLGLETARVHSLAP